MMICWVWERSQCLRRLLTQHDGHCRVVKALKMSCLARQTVDVIENSGHCAELPGSDDGTLSFEEVECPRHCGRLIMVAVELPKL